MHHESSKSVSNASPERAARELVPLLRRSDESVTTIRELIALTPGDEARLEQRGVPEGEIRRAKNYRAAVLQEFDAIMERRM